MRKRQQNGFKDKRKENKRVLLLHPSPTPQKDRIVRDEKKKKKKCEKRLKQPQKKKLNQKKGEMSDEELYFCPYFSLFSMSSQFSKMTLRVTISFSLSDS